MKIAINRFNVRVAVGDTVDFHHARGGTQSDTLAEMEREAGRGIVCTMVSGLTCTADDIKSSMSIDRAWLRMGSDYLTDAKPYGSKAKAVETFRAVASELARYGQRLEASIHFADSLDTLNEYPDYVLSIGPRGGVKVEAA